MFQRVIHLQNSCSHLCQDGCETTKFLLKTSEWDQEKHIMELLEPLAKATNILSKSKSPILTHLYQSKSPFSTIFTMLQTVDMINLNSDDR
jgi:hypothetical protein